MTAEIVSLVVNEAGENWRVPDDQVLEAAKGNSFHRLLVVGEYEDSDDLYIAGSCNSGESLILLERVKHYIVFGGE